MKQANILKNGLWLLNNLKFSLMAATLCCCHFFSYAQNRNSVWCFGDSALIDFSDTSNIIVGSCGLDTRGSCASIANENGKLLFYAETRATISGNTTLVFDTTHQVMPNGNNIVGRGWYQELVIVPNPANDSTYYLFSIGVTSIYGLYYSIIDMRLNNGLGAVTVKNVQLQSFEQVDCLNAVKHGNGRDWWLITKFADTNLTTLNRFIVFLVTPNGISNPVFYDFNDATDMDFQKIIFNTAYTKIMCLNILGYMCEFDFDRCSGVISNPHVIYPEITTFPYNRVFWEGAYSPNDSVFYIATNRYSLLLNCYLLQFDLTASDIPASCDTLDDYLFPIEPGAVRLAPDGKIYYSRAYKSPGVNSFPYADTMYNYINMNLSVINEPDSLGAACNYQPFSFYLGGKRTYLGLPNNPDYDLGALTGSVCDTLTNLTPDPSPLGEGSIKVFPNPAKEKVRFEYSEPVSENSQIEVYDNLGVMVKKIILTKGSISTTFSINDLPPGVYSCRVSINNVFKQVDKLTIIR